MKKIKRKITILLTASAIVMMFSVPCFAASTSWYERNIEILHTNDAISSALRTIGWFITEFLCLITDVCGVLYDKSFALIDITNYGNINNIMTTLQPVLIALTILSVSVYGIMLVVVREKKPEILSNVLAGILMVSCSFYLFSALNNLAYGFKEGILGESKMQQSYQVVDSNIIDLIELDKTGKIENLNYEKGIGVKTGAGIKNKKTFNTINVNETLDYAHEDKGKDLYNWSAGFNEKMSVGIIRTGDTYNTYKIDNGVWPTTIGNGFYYRYHFDFIVCWLQILSYLIVIICLSYKNVLIAYDLIVARLLGYVFASDISNGRRLKAIINFIGDTYILLCISVLSVKLFEVMCSYLTNTGVTGLLKGILSIFIAYVVIDGPNLAQRLLGMDAGLSHSLARTMGLIEIGRGIGRHFWNNDNKPPQKDHKPEEKTKSEPNNNKDNEDEAIAAMNDEKSKDGNKEPKKDSNPKQTSDSGNTDAAINAMNGAENGTEKNTDFMETPGSEEGTSDTQNSDFMETSKPDFDEVGNKDIANNYTAMDFMDRPGSVDQLNSANDTIIPEKTIRTSSSILRPRTRNTAPSDLFKKSFEEPEYKLDGESISKDNVQSILDGKGKEN